MRHLAANDGHAHLGSGWNNRAQILTDWPVQAFIVPFWQGGSTAQALHGEPPQAQSCTPRGFLGCVTMPYSILERKKPEMEQGTGLVLVPSFVKPEISYHSKTP